MKKKINIRYTLLVCIASCSGLIHASSRQGITAFTKPCADVTLSFVLPGSIAEINFKEGDSVKVGDVLVKHRLIRGRYRRHPLEIGLGRFVESHFRLPGRRFRHGVSQDHHGRAQDTDRWNWSGKEMRRAGACFS